MRLPNGYGSVYKVGKRRLPWRAVTSAPERKHVGYFATKKEAVKALAELSEDFNDVTVAQVYARWKEEKFPTLSTTKHYEKAYSRLEPIWDKPMSSLKLDDLEKTIAQADCSESSEFVMKAVLNQMYRYAMKHDIVQKNYATYLNNPQPKTKAKRVPFTKEEIETLFLDGSFSAHMILVAIYSGWRPAELLSYTIDGDLMRGGVKTSAGKDRIVPVHPKIKEFVQEYRMSYYEFRKLFDATMLLHGMSHTPHECRHTFISMAKEQDVNESVIKLLVGHARTDITESVYTHRTIESLRRAVARIDWE